MEIRDLRFFCVTADLEHVTKAAEQLGVSQPFLTRIIGQLEKELGTALFDNVGRKIRLNSFGEVFYGLAKKALTEFDNISVEMDRLLDRHESTLTVLANSEGYSVDIAMEYNAEFPNNTLSISYASRNDIIDSLISGEADFAICAPPIPEDPMRGIITELVFHEYVVVLLPPDHPMLAKQILTFSDLIGEPMVSTLKGSGVRISLDQAFDKYNFHPQVVCETNDPTLVAKMVLRGMGYAIMPRSSMLLDPQLRNYCRNLDIKENHGVLGLSYNKNFAVGEEAEGFIDFIRDFFDRRDKAVFGLI